MLLKLTLTMLFVAISLTLITFTFTIAGIALGKKLYDNIQKENHQENGKIVQKIMKTYAIINCIGYPIVMISAWVLYVNKFVLPIFWPGLTRYAILTLRLVYTLLRSYVGLNSLIIAICRYSLILCKNQVVNIGIDRFQSIILSISVVMPFILAVSNEATHPVEIIWKCLFMPYDKQKLLFDTRNVSDIFCSRHHVQSISESQIYTVYNEYLPPSITQGMKEFHAVFVVMIGSNVLEGFLYGHIFTHVKRYKQNIYYDYYNSPM